MAPSFPQSHDADKIRDEQAPGAYVHVEAWCAMLKRPQCARVCGAASREQKRSVLLNDADMHHRSVRRRRSVCAAFAPIDEQHRCVTTVFAAATQ